MMTAADAMITEFTDYCYEWYGKGGLYDHNASHHQVKIAVCQHIANPDRLMAFQGDSLDREQVREWLSRTFGLAEKKGVSA